TVDPHQLCPWLAGTIRRKKTFGKAALSQHICVNKPNDDRRKSIRVATRELKIDRHSPPDQGQARSKM
ncbi:hypothetical protein, partial [Sphingobium sp. TomMM35A]